MSMPPFSRIAVLSLLVSACAEDLGASLADGGESTADAAGDGGAQIEHVDDGEIVHTTVDATDATAWIHLDLETRAQVDVAEPQASDAWDLGFSRFNITINGGVSGPGGMEAIVIEGALLEDVNAVPDGAWVTDAADGDDDNDDPDTVFAQWYDYDFTTHVLSARPVVYVVRTVEGGHFAIAVDDYYDDAGSSGWMQLRWKAVDP